MVEGEMKRVCWWEEEDEGEGEGKDMERGGGARLGAGVVG